MWTNGWGNWLQEPEWKILSPKKYRYHLRFSTQPGFFRQSPGLDRRYSTAEAVIAASSSGVDCVWTMDGDLMSSVPS
jgi:hypothetical protein